MSRLTVPIFYACDDSFMKFTMVSIRSLIDNASPDHDYVIYVLNSGISEDMRRRTRDMARDNVRIFFPDVSRHLESISGSLPLRDYYSKTTYYRLFIAEMFPEYDKAVYIDGDTVVQGDVSRLFATDIGDSYLGACHEQAMVQTDVYGRYVEQVLGISRHSYFNAGLLLINCREFRERRVLERFCGLLSEYNFVVTQDEDYLNLICKDHVYWLDQRWNTEMYGDVDYPLSEADMLHYIMVSKPWHYRDCMGGDAFWRYASETDVYGEIREILENYTAEQRARDAECMDNLANLAEREIARPDNYLKQLNARRATDRVEIVEKIRSFERQGRFIEDVEDDPPSRTLMPSEIKYADRGIRQRVKTWTAFAVAHRFVNSLRRKNQFIIKEFRGLENLSNLSSGAVITCNHFNAFDSFVMQLTYEAAKPKGRRFYRIIREGNYTSFPGFYGFLMRNCNTLPLSSNMGTMKKFVTAVDSLLKGGHLILIYPEQSMWWNYRKPKPLQDGGFTFAYRNKVPVLPCFITMRDSDVLGPDGFPVQEYTVHVGEPISPDLSLSYREGVADMKNRNYAMWKEIYEREYGMPLEYETNRPELSGEELDQDAV